MITAGSIVAGGSGVESLETVSRIIATACITKECTGAGGGVRGPAGVKGERTHTVGRVVDPVRIVPERFEPRGRIAIAAGIAGERGAANGSIVIAVVVQERVITKERVGGVAAAAISTNRPRLR